jgi:hypothetical protein
MMSCLFVAAVRGGLDQVGHSMANTLSCLFVAAVRGGLDQVGHSMANTLSRPQHDRLRG